MPYTHVLAADLGWNVANHRVAVALCRPGGRVAIMPGDHSDAMIHATLDRLPPSASVLVLLDVPIEGMHHLQGRATRPLDRALAHAGIAALPAAAAGERGPRLRDALLAAHASQLIALDVREMYPYAVYRVLAYLESRDLLRTLVAPGERSWLAPHFTTQRSPRYKRREPDAQRRWEAIHYLHALLVHPALGLDWAGLPPPAEVRGRAEDYLVDTYEAALGAVLGAHVLSGSPYALLAGDSQQGEMLLLADAWLRTRLADRLPVRPVCADSSQPPQRGLRLTPGSGSA